MLALPLAVLFEHGLREGVVRFWAEITNPIALAAVRLTIFAATVMTLINAVMGTLTAYMLVRYRFFGSRLLQQSDRSAVRHSHSGDGRDAGVALRPAADVGGVAGSARRASHLRPAGDSPGAALRHLSIRHPHSATGLDGDRPRAGGGRLDAGRVALDDIHQGHSADDYAGDHQRRAAQLRARPGRVRIDSGGGGQHPAQHADRAGLHLRADRVAESDGGERGLHSAAGAFIRADGAGGLDAGETRRRTMSQDRAGIGNRRRARASAPNVRGVRMGCWSPS